MALKGQRVLITGGTGSFGRAFAKKLLETDEVQAVIIFSRDEWKQWEMKGSEPIFSHPKIRYFLGDVRDKERLRRAFHEVDLIVHAAALKQVPAAEYNPTEFVKTNVIGTMNVIDAALDCRVKKVITLSTDKAVNPINLYGATKLCADKLTVAGNSYTGKLGTPVFSVVRYGNVLGSRGSIIPLWKDKIKEGAKEIPVTSLDMTRFWITIDEAVNFVIHTFDRMRGGEIFVPKVASTTIASLADAIAPGLEKKIIGIREGEKLHEVLISSDDAPHTFEFSDYYLIAPETFKREPSFLEKFMQKEKGKPVSEGFVFASNTNPRMLTKKEILDLI